MPKREVIELQKKSPNTLKALERAQKCEASYSKSPFDNSSPKLVTGQTMRMHVFPPERFG